MACCLKLRWESKVTPSSFSVVKEVRKVPAIFIEDGGQALEVHMCADEHI